MKLKRSNVVDVPYRTIAEEQQTLVPGQRAQNIRRCRGRWVTTLLRCLVGKPLGFAFITLPSALAALVGEVLRPLIVPVLRVVAVAVFAFAGMVATVYLGAYAIRGGVNETRSLADHWHAAIHQGSDALLALVPSASPETAAPRAVPVLRDGDGYTTLPAMAANSSIGTLLPNLYPQPPGLPQIDNDMLELAGGHRMQELVTGILYAVEQVESSGQPLLIGDNGLAYGPLQVRHEPCEDLRQFFGVVIDPRLCNGNRELSEYVVRLYLGYWGTQYEMQTGRPATAEVLCRTWNGGPDQGPRNKTDIYWAKCRKHDSSLTRLAAQ